MATSNALGAMQQASRSLASHFVWTNRSRETVTLDLKHAQALRADGLI
jgi:crotonobetainyl-CoA:carnitine CoA-transferase CaiB-like acyl-CoA transferase